MASLDRIRYERKCREDDLKMVAFEAMEADWELNLPDISGRSYGSLIRNIISFFKGALMGYIFIVGVPIMLFVYLYGAHWFKQHGIIVPDNIATYLTNTAYAIFLYAVADIFGKYGRAIWWTVIIYMVMSVMPTIFS